MAKGGAQFAEAVWEKQTEKKQRYPGQGMARNQMTKKQLKRK
jgi:hypothetical protein